MATDEVVIVREWNAEAFHRRVLDFEARGYRARRDSYSITAETNPETGEVVHLHSIELLRVAPGEPHAVQLAGEARGSPGRESPRRRATADGT